MKTVDRLPPDRQRSRAPGRASANTAVAGVVAAAAGATAVPQLLGVFADVAQVATLARSDLLLVANIVIAALGLVALFGPGQAQYRKSGPRVVAAVCAVIVCATLAGLGLRDRLADEVTPTGAAQVAAGTALTALASPENDFRTGPRRVLGRAYENCLFSPAGRSGSIGDRADAKYNLDRRYTRFKAAVALSDDSAPGSTAHLRIALDGVDAYDTILTAGNEPHSVDLDVSGGRELHIWVYRDEGSSAPRGEVVVANARLS